MEVSQFEIVFKPQSPVGNADTVLQGYFLAISNLEDATYRFQLEFVTSSLSDADRQLADNVAVRVDTPGGRDSASYGLLGAPDAKSFFLDDLIEIPAHGTALVAVLPSDAFAQPPTETFETRGYVRLTLPPTAPFVGASPALFMAQGDAPVRVMLTPQNRAQYLAASGGINAQTQAGLPTAAGRAVAEVTPESPRFRFPVEPDDRDFDLSDQSGDGRLSEVARRAREILNGVDAAPETAPEALAGLVARVQQSGAAIDAVNRQLERAGADLRLTRPADAA
jgi:hypothetical protein